MWKISQGTKTSHTHTQRERERERERERRARACTKARIRPMSFLWTNAEIRLIVNIRKLYSIYYAKLYEDKRVLNNLLTFYICLHYRDKAATMVEAIQKFMLQLFPLLYQLWTSWVIIYYYYFIIISYKPL